MLKAKSELYIHINPFIGLICFIFFIISIISLISFNSISCRAVSVSGAMTREYHMKVGDRRRGVITVSNPDQEPVEVRIYQRDYQFFADGRNLFHSPGTMARSNAGWIDLDVNRVTVMPAGEKDIHYSIEIPKVWEYKGQTVDTGALAGTYWSLLMVEPVTAEKKKADEGLAIRTQLRFGLQVVTHINREGDKSLEICDRKLVYDRENDSTFLEIALENTGSSWLNINAKAELFSDDGHHISDIVGSGGRLYPGTSKYYHFDLSDEKADSYQILISFIDDKKNDKKVWAAQYALDLKEVGM